MEYIFYGLAAMALTLACYIRWANFQYRSEEIIVNRDEAFRKVPGMKDHAEFVHGQILEHEHQAVVSIVILKDGSMSLSMQNTQDVEADQLAPILRRALNYVTENPTPHSMSEMRQSDFEDR